MATATLPADLNFATGFWFRRHLRKKNERGCSGLAVTILPAKPHIMTRLSALEQVSAVDEDEDPASERRIRGSLT